MNRRHALLAAACAAFTLAPPATAADGKKLKRRSLTLESIRPNYCHGGKALPFVILGKDFQSGISVALDYGITVKELVFVSSDALFVRLDVPNAGPLPELYEASLTVTNTNGETYTLPKALIVADC